MKQIKRLLKYGKKEDGNIILVFAATMVIICFFIGIALDFTIIYMERNAIQNIAQLMREERFTFRESVRYAENPGMEASKLVIHTAVSNQFDGSVTVYFEEEEPISNFRSYKMRIELTNYCDFHFGRIFGLDDIKLTVTIDGGESYGEGASDVVWHPEQSVDNYNGSYTSQGNITPVFIPGDLPEW